MTTSYRTANPLTFACTDCGRRWHTAIDCACGAGPLVDLEKPEFREMIVEMEDRRAESHGQTLLWVGVGIGMAMGIFVVVAFPLFVRLIPLPIPFSLPIKVVGLMILFTVLATKLLVAMFPARRKFPELVANRARIALPSRLLAPRRATIIGLGLVLALGLGITIATPYVQTWIAEEERDHRVTIGKRYERLVECAEEARAAATDDEWTASCKRPLEGLYESIDNRSADAPLRATLEEKFRCAEKCDPKALAKHFGDITEAVRSMGFSGRPLSTRPGPAYDPSSPFSPLRARPTRPTSWNY